MALRVTQQSVDVLSEATGGKIRVTQFYIEVLGAAATSVSASNTLALTDTATPATDRPKSITDTLSLVQALTNADNLSASNGLLFLDSVSVLVDHVRAVSDALGISDSVAKFNTHNLSVSHSLGITDVAAESDVHIVSLSHVLGLIDTALGDDGLSPSINDALDFAQSLTCNIKSLDVLDTLSLVSAAPQPPLSVSSVLAFTHTASSGTKTESVSSVLALSDQAVDKTRQIVAHTLAFNQQVVHNVHQLSVANAIIFEQTVATVKSTNVASFMSLTDQVKRALTLPRTVSSAIEFVQSVELFIDRNGVLCNYSPFIGSGQYTFTATPPTITPSTLTLFWPIVAPSLTVVLRNPDFGNKIAFNANRINRKSRGGTKQIFRKATWPKFRTLSMDVAMLDQDQIDDFITFLNTTIGLQVGLKDQDGFMWKGVIMTPETPITQLGGTISCPNYATSFQFEGELI